ncbi:MAG: hypothetical protein EAY65_05605 [Alphaproteobacteria bacterium]|nr:MAG: hypothetical protein EAY65_05605 [Alphaproteobacteria bacterium]
MKNRAVIFVAAVALLLHTLLPFYASYHVPTSSDAQQLSSLFGDKVLLCTADGFKLFNWDDVLSGKEHPKPNTYYKCPLCYVAAHDHAITPNYSSFVSVASLNTHYAFLFSLENTPLSSEVLWRKLRTRSPPFSFVA